MPCRRLVVIANPKFFKTVRGLISLLLAMSTSDRHCQPRRAKQSGLVGCLGLFPGYAGRKDGRVVALLANTGGG
jgi:hypothetical protein